MTLKKFLKQLKELQDKGIVTVDAIIIQKKNHTIVATKKK